jgi:MerR family transcriptional regulator, light-induced transcriptional regulator
VAPNADDQHHEPVQTESGPVPPAPGTDRPELSVAAAARRLGVAPATLRTWARRYGIGPSAHVPGRHRRYSPTDVARLDLMRHALVRGASPADAARLATTAALPARAPGHAEPEPEPEPEPPGRPDPPNGRVRGGGAALSLPGAGRRAHGLARAALMLDPVPVRALLAESVAAIGIEATWDDVVRPVLGAISDRWQHTGAGVEVEHQLSECVAGVFGQLAAGLVTDPDARPVLLAGMPGEQHMLPMTVLAAALADVGVPCRLLGANLPVVALVAAIRRTAPSLVVLWAQASEVADVEALDSLPRTRPRFRLAVAGPGWDDRELPGRMERLGSLVAARRAITGMVPV